MGLIFDYFLWRGGGIGCPPLKSVLIELEKFKRQFWKALMKSWRVLYILKMSKNAFYLAKTPSKIKHFVKCFVMFEFLTFFIL